MEMMNPDVLILAPIASLVDLDATFLIQWTIFLVTAGVLHVLVFKPLLRLEDLRRAQTTGAIEHARQMEVNAQDQVQQYEVEITKSRKNGAESLHDLRDKAAHDAHELHLDARKKADALLAEAMPRLQASYETSRTEVQAVASGLSDQIVNKVLDGKA